MRFLLVGCFSVAAVSFAQAATGSLQQSDRIAVQIAADAMARGKAATAAVDAENKRYQKAVANWEAARKAMQEPTPDVEDLNEKGQAKLLASLKTKNQAGLAALSRMVAGCAEMRLVFENAASLAATDAATLQRLSEMSTAKPVSDALALAKKWSDGWATFAKKQRDVCTKQHEILEQWVSDPNLQ